LRYTNFVYSNLKINETQPLNKAIEISVQVTNSGKYDGDEVVQVYYTNPKSDVLNTNRTLINFDRISLKAGGTKTVSFSIQPKQLAQFTNSNFELSAGEIIFSVGGLQPNEKAITDKKVIVKKINLIGKTVLF
jgi:beta-glucosidase